MFSYQYAQKRSESCILTLCGEVILLRAASEQKSGVQNCIETLLVFVKKGIRNLNCYVAPIKFGSKASV